MKEEKRSPYESLFEMSNLSIKLTKLPYIIWVSSGEGESGKRLQHGPRIKVEIDKQQRIPISISNTPEVMIDHKFSKTAEFKEISEWVIKHQISLLSHWNKKITADELIEEIKKGS